MNKNKANFYKILFATITTILLWSCEEPTPQPSPTIYFKQTSYELNIGEKIELAPKITYDNGTTYEWYLNDKIISTQKNISHQSNEPNKSIYTFIATTDVGSDTATITVETLYIVDFEEFKLKKDTALYGQDGANYYTSNNINFPTLYGDSIAKWNGYAVSTGRDQTRTNIKNRYSAYPGYGSDTLNHYLVFHQDNNNLTYEFYFEQGRKRHIKSMDITNTTLLFYTIKEGTETIKRFDEGDWFRITVEGIDSNGNLTKSMVIPLADYTDKNKTKRSMLELWKTIPLEELGEVNKVRFILKSSQNDSNGMMITPGYFCIDNIKLYN